MGWIVGRLVGFFVLKFSEKHKLLKTGDGLLAPSLTLLVYGLTEMIHGYGFVAVFVTAVTFRHFEKEHEYHEELHSLTEQLERTLVAIMLLLFGGALVSGILDALTWPMALFSLAFLLIIRPLAAYVSLFKTGILLKEKLAISFFGIRGLGSIFYLAFALREAPFKFKDELWAIVALCILVSIIIHGLTATPIMNRLKKSIPEERIPE
jgi:NhaP-type Na+/H+ or K+/H+ antiporter